MDNDEGNRPGIFQMSGMSRNVEYLGTNKDLPGFIFHSSGGQLYCLRGNGKVEVLSEPITYKKRRNIMDLKDEAKENLEELKKELEEGHEKVSTFMEKHGKKMAVIGVVVVLAMIVGLFLGAL